MWMVVIVVIANDDSDDLLTDEQKLEKQKELALEKEQEELKRQEDTKWWNDKLNLVFVEKPPVVVFGIGIGLLLSLIIFQKTRYGRNCLDDMIYGGWLGIFNAKTMFILMIGALYLMWVTGFGIF